MEHIVRLEQVRKTFGRIVAVDGLSFSVMKGDIFGFLGPNGSGKSTTLRMLLGLVRPDSGRILLFGNPWNPGQRQVLGRIGSLIEGPDFYPYLSGYKNLELLGKLAGLRRPHARISEVLELVGLKGRENDFVKTYSHGMKQRLGIAQALLHQPELLVLDEPTEGLDPQGLRDIRELLLRLQRQGITVLLSSHLLAEVEQVATRMAIVHRGKLLAEGMVAELLSENDLIVTVESDERAVEHIRQSRWLDQLLEAKGTALRLRMMRRQIPELAAFLHQKGCPLYRLSDQRPLEEYFLQLTGNHAES
ncbi:MAG: ABC transporter ATP-binding protein [Chitinophagales bacterium]|nr:ABC transporter ATP-binding protein [Chitinophagales bacterium]